MLKLYVKLILLKKYKDLKENPGKLQLKQDYRIHRIRIPGSFGIRTGSGVSVSEQKGKKFGYRDPLTVFG